MAKLNISLFYDTSHKCSSENQIPDSLPSARNMAIPTYAKKKKAQMEEAKHTHPVWYTALVGFK